MPFSRRGATSSKGRSLRRFLIHRCTKPPGTSNGERVQAKPKNQATQSITENKQAKRACLLVAASLSSCLRPRAEMCASFKDTLLTFSTRCQCRCLPSFPSPETSSMYYIYIYKLPTGKYCSVHPRPHFSHNYIQHLFMGILSVPSVYYTDA